MTYKRLNTSYLWESHRDWQWASQVLTVIDLLALWERSEFQFPALDSIPGVNILETQNRPFSNPNSKEGCFFRWANDILEGNPKTKNFVQQGESFDHNTYEVFLVGDKNSLRIKFENQLLWGDVIEARTDFLSINKEDADPNWVVFCGQDHFVIYDLEQARNKQYWKTSRWH